MAYICIVLAHRDLQSCPLLKLPLINISNIDVNFYIHKQVKL